MKNFIKKFYKNNFVYGTKEKLSKLTILSILILDFMVYAILNLGMDIQLSTIKHPTEIYPYRCTDAIESTKFDFNQSFYRPYNNHYEKNRYEIDSRCEKIIVNLEGIDKEQNIQELKKSYSKLSLQENNLNSDLNYLKENYNTVLLEKIGSQNVDKSIVKFDVTTENIKEKSDNLQKELDEVIKQKNELINNFLNLSSVQGLISYVEQNRVQLDMDLNEEYKIYNYKLAFTPLAFLLSLVIIFFYLMKNYIKKERYILYIIFKNILIITLIPTLISLFSLIYKFIPKIFLAKVVEFFYNLEVPFILYYFMIIVFVVIFAFIIIKIQKRFKEQSEKLKNNKISFIESYNKNICNLCGNKVDYNFMNYCPCCKNQLKIDCKNCGEKTIKSLDFCMFCSHIVLK